MKYGNILQTGQDHCYDSKGQLIPCQGSGQDGEYRVGATWPSPRFVTQDHIVQDLLTDLVWTRNANPNEYPVTWQEGRVALSEETERLIAELEKELAEKRKERAEGRR